MDDDFSKIMQAAHAEVSDTFVKEVCNKFLEIKFAHPEKSDIIECCIKGLTQKKPNLAEILVAVHALNGGVAFRYGENEGVFESLAEELEGLERWGEDYDDKKDLSEAIEGIQISHSTDKFEELSDKSTQEEKQKPRNVIITSLFS